MYIYEYVYMCVYVSFSYTLVTKSVCLSSNHSDYRLQLGHGDAKKPLLRSAYINGCINTRP